MQLYLKMKFWEAETNTTDNQKYKIEIDLLTGELSGFKNVIEELSSKKRKLNPIVTKVLEHAATSMGIMMTTKRHISMVVKATTKNDAGVSASNNID